MAYVPPSKLQSEKPQTVLSIDRLLSFRDTWREPLANFNFESLLEAREKAARDAAERLAGNVAPLAMSAGGFHVTDKTKLSTDEVLIREAQRALNQLAEENFDAVVPPLLQPALFHPAVAEQVVERIFEKCIVEPKFAPLYARMCLCLCHYEHEFLNKGASFRLVLVAKVQHLFEEEPVPLEKKFTDEDMSAARKRKMSNTMLVGQLLLCGVLSRKVYTVILNMIFMGQQFPPEISVEVGAQLIEICCCATPKELALLAKSANASSSLAAAAAASAGTPTAASAAGSSVAAGSAAMAATASSEPPPNPFIKDRQLAAVHQQIEKLVADSNTRFCKRVQFKLMEILDLSRRGWTARPSVAALTAAAAVATSSSSSSSAATAAAAAGAGGASVDGAAATTPATPCTADATNSMGTPATSSSGAAFPREPRAPAIPTRCPKLTPANKNKFVALLRQAPPSEAAAFQAMLTQVSVILPSCTVPVNRMAAVAAFVDGAARSSEAEFHAEAAAVIGCAPGGFELHEVVAGFRWAVVDGVRDSICEDCPKYFDRLAALFARAVLGGKRRVAFIALIRDVFAPAAERVIDITMGTGSATKEEKEAVDAETCAEEFVRAWDAFVKRAVEEVRGGGGDAPAPLAPLPKFAECAEAWAKVPWAGAMREIALADVMGAFVTFDVATAAEMRAWVDANAKSRQLACVVEAVGLMC